MSKVQFQVARQYIEEGNYDKAREVLRQLDHPSTQKWLDKIDELDPPFPDVTPLPKPNYRKPSHNRPSVDLTDKELRYLKQQMEMRRVGRVISLVVLGLITFCGSLAVLIQASMINFARPTGFFEFIIGSGQLLCVLAFVIPALIYTWNMDI